MAGGKGKIALGYCTVSVKVPYLPAETGRAEEEDTFIKYVPAGRTGDASCEARM